VEPLITDGGDVASDAAAATEAAATVEPPTAAPVEPRTAPPVELSVVPGSAAPAGEERPILEPSAPEPASEAPEALIPTPAVAAPASELADEPEPEAEPDPEGPPAIAAESERSTDAADPAPQLPSGPAPGPLPGLQDLPPVPGMVDHDGAATAEEPAPAPAPVPEPVAAAPAAPAPSPFARPLPRVMAIANQKGGVGKTTTAVNLGACLADLGYRVLVVDLDPQGNASTGMGVNIRDLQGSMYDVVLHDLPIEDCVEATSVRNLFCAPSSLELAGAEIELVPAFSREMRLKKALDEVTDDYDFVLIDCPPSLGLLTVNAFAAATEVVVPIQCEYYALEGLGQLLRNVNLVQKNLNPALELSAIILVMYDARTKLADQVVNEVREHFGEKVCRQVVPRTVRLSEAPSFGQPIIAFDSSSRGAIAYRELAKEVSGGTPQRAG
jgi:chromosome partitioning protein